MLLQSRFEKNAATHPAKEALICGADRISYGEFEAQANRLARSFQSAGICRGDRVVIWLENSIEAALAIFAALKAGAVFVPVHPGTKEKKLQYILNNCRATGWVTSVNTLSRLEVDVGWVPSMKAIWTVGSTGTALSVGTLTPTDLHSECTRADYSSTALENRCIDVDLAALIYTSGSTGNPKGVMLTHVNMISAATSITTYLENTSDDIILSTLPLSFDYGLYQLLMTFFFGGTLVLEKSFAFPHIVLSKFPKERITGFPLVPTMFAILLGMDLSKYDLSRVRYVSSTAQALPVDHIQRFRAALPTAKIFSMYGLTECKRVSYLPPEQLDVRPGSVGRGMPNEEVYIVDEEGKRVGPRVIGELVVRGSNVMRGYWELPNETAAVLRPGDIPGELVLYTGDLFYVDEEGYLFYVDRKDGMIKSQGEKVSSREIENVITSLPGVMECAVLGIPDPILGNAIKVVVHKQSNSELTAKDILRHCQQHLELFMIPKFVEFRDELPVTNTGKVSKRMLAEEARSSRSEDE